MSQSQSIPLDPRHNDKEVHPHSTLEVANEPQNVTRNNEYPQDPGPPYAHFPGGERSHGPNYQQDRFPPDNQVGRTTKKQNRWTTAIIITSTLVSALVAGGAVGAGLGSSLANCRTNLEYDYQAQKRIPLYQDRQILIVILSHDQPPTTTSTVFMSAKYSSTLTPLKETWTTASIDVTGEATTTTGGLFVNCLPEPTSTVKDLDMDCEALRRDEQVTQRSEYFNVYCNVDLVSGGKQDASGNEVFIGDLVGLVAYTLSDCLQACSLYNKQSGIIGRDDGCGAVTFCTAMQKYSLSAGGNCWLKNTTMSIGVDTNSGDCHSAVKVSL